MELKGKIKINSIVNTPHGRGIVVKEEVFKDSERWGVELEDNPLSFPVVYYFKHEIVAI